MIEYVIVGALSGLAVFWICQIIAKRTREARHPAAAMREWHGATSDERGPICLHDPQDPINGTRIRVASPPSRKGSARKTT